MKEESSRSLVVWLCLLAAVLVLGFNHRGNGPLLRQQEEKQTLGETFGTAYKQFYDTDRWPTNVELPVFERECKGHCFMQHFWSGGGWNGYYDSIVSYYVDGESQASVVIPFGLGHGSDMVQADSPWNAGGLFGKTGQPSGLFNTYRIPFRKSIRITVTLVCTEASKPKVDFWIILRGTEIPLGLAHLHSHYDVDAKAKTMIIRDAKVDPDAMIPFLKTEAAGAMVELVTIAIQTTKQYPFYFEGCFRLHDLHADLYKDPPRMLLSSGTEDYFLGTFYFNKGKYMTPLGGVTNLENYLLVDDENIDVNDETPQRFSGYRAHGHQDPLLIKNGGLMTYRNGDPNSCMIDYPPAPLPFPMPKDRTPVSFSSFVLYYEL